MPVKKPKKDWSIINDRIKNRNKKYKADERIFVPTFNDKNVAKVVMRFLDSPDTDLPYATQHNHFFNDIGGWMITNCPTSIDKSCPICEDIYKKDLYNKDNDVYYDRKKKTYFYTNVLIIDDKNNPENEGKVFIFKFGKKIMEKIEDAIDDGKTPWDEEAGENFTFSAKKKGKMSNYDASYFSDNDTALSEYGDTEEILAKAYPLGEFTDEKEYKSYDDIKSRYLVVIGEDTDSSAPSQKKRSKVEEEEEIIDEDDDDVPNDIGDGNMFDDDDDDSFFDDLED